VQTERFSKNGEEKEDPCKISRGCRNKSSTFTERRKMWKSSRKRNERCKQDEYAIRRGKPYGRGKSSGRGKIT